MITVDYNTWVWLINLSNAVISLPYIVGIALLFMIFYGSGSEFYIFLFWPFSAVFLFFSIMLFAAYILVSNVCKKGAISKFVSLGYLLYSLITAVLIALFFLCIRNGGDVTLASALILGYLFITCLGAVATYQVD